MKKLLLTILIPILLLTTVKAQTGWDLNQCIVNYGSPDSYNIEFSPIHVFGACDHYVWNSTEEGIMGHYEFHVWILRQDFRCKNGVILHQGIVVCEVRLE